MPSKINVPMMVARKRKEKDASGAGSTIGSALGGILGTIIAPGAGTAIGASLGGAAGGLVGNAIDGDPAIDAAKNVATAAGAGADIYSQNTAIKGAEEQLSLEALKRKRLEEDLKRRHLGLLSPFDGNRQ